MVNNTMDNAADVENRKPQGTDDLVYSTDKCEKK